MPGEAEETPTPTPTPSLMDAPPAADPALEEKGDAPPADNPDLAGDKPDGADDGGAGGDDAGPEGDEDKGEEGGEDEGVPEEYADFTAPEGIELDAEMLEEFKPIAKELGLKQDDAQKLIDMQSKVAQRWQEAVQQHVVDTRLGWRDAAQKDAEIGGEKFAENLALAKVGRDTFGTDALKTLLDESGLGDHPEVIRFFYKVGKANSEHDFVNQGKPEKSKSFYDHPTSKK